MDPKAHNGRIKNDYGQNLSWCSSFAQNSSQIEVLYTYSPESLSPPPAYPPLFNRMMNRWLVSFVNLFNYIKSPKIMKNCIQFQLHLTKEVQRNLTRDPSL
ncbi:hypothetical protein MKX01_017006 [Papaver californicum]|nr:hypothetical protein MKX01_017006 [Papaver californicum]